MISAEVKTRTAFVTGATGFVGFYVVRSLLENGLRVKVLVRKNSDKSVLNNLKKIWNFIEKFGVVLAVIFLVFLGFANRNAIDRYDESSKNSSSNNSIDNKALQSLDRHLTRFWQDSNFEQLTSDFKKANLQLVGLSRS